MFILHLIRSKLKLSCVSLSLLLLKDLFLLHFRASFTQYINFNSKNRMNEFFIKLTQRICCMQLPLNLSLHFNQEIRSIQLLFVTDYIRDQINNTSCHTRPHMLEYVERRQIKKFVGNRYKCNNSFLPVYKQSKVSFPRESDSRYHISLFRADLELSSNFLAVSFPHSPSDLFFTLKKF